MFSIANIIRNSTSNWKNCFCLFTNYKVCGCLITCFVKQYGSLVYLFVYSYISYCPEKMAVLFSSGGHKLVTLYLFTCLPRRKGHGGVLLCCVPCNRRVAGSNLPQAMRSDLGQVAHPWLSVRKAAGNHLTHLRVVLKLKNQPWGRDPSSCLLYLVGHQQYGCLLLVLGTVEGVAWSARVASVWRSSTQPPGRNPA